MPRAWIGALVLAGAMLSPGAAPAQTPVDWDQLGAWYMLFWSTRFDDSSVGLQGDVQHRNWNAGTDLEQLLIRGGLTYALPESPVLLTGGVAHITSGEFGDSDEISAERRVYQEALVSQSFGQVVFLRHRYRYAQRWVDGQDFRTRFRYALFGNVALNGRGTGSGSAYLALYNRGLHERGARDRARQDYRTLRPQPVLHSSTPHSASESPTGPRSRPAT